LVEELQFPLSGAVVSAPAECHSPSQIRKIQPA
jgi:hypothetical protein